jgi:hypothetical protein
VDDLSQQAGLALALLVGRTGRRAIKALTILARAALTEPAAGDQIAIVLRSDLANLAVPAIAVAVGTSAAVGNLLAAAIQSVAPGPGVLEANRRRTAGWGTRWPRPQRRRKFLCPRCRAGLCDRRPPRKHLLRLRFYALDVGLVFATRSCTGDGRQLLGFYALDVGLVFATQRRRRSCGPRRCFYALDVGLVFATQALRRTQDCPWH